MRSASKRTPTAGMSRTSAFKTVGLPALVLIACGALLAPSAAHADSAAPVLFATDAPAHDNTIRPKMPISDLAIVGDQLYAGYGDYGLNTGPTEIMSYALGTGTATDQFTLNGEAVDHFRILDGALYAPDIDPKLAWDANVGYATNASGSWRYVFGAPFEHVFDIAKIGSTLFLSGQSLNPDKAKYGAANELAVIKKSTDGGATWTIEKWRDSGSAAIGYDRYYQLTVAGDTLYAQATLDSGIVQPVDTWRAGSWSTFAQGGGVSFTGQDVPGVLGGTRFDSAKTAVFNGNIIQAGSRFALSGSGYGVWVQAQNARPSGKYSPAYVPMPGRVVDLYQDGGVLYALSQNSSGTTSYVSSTTDGATWQTRATVTNPLGEPFAHGTTTIQNPVGSYSLAVNGSDAYIGTSESRIYRVSLDPAAAGSAPLPTTQPPGKNKK
ncbi:hypothetical protein [Microbacterium panaciterrae]|uniref:Exo-alpha-sialidase n=1 Tax=Microbacterium panaciterrae TaxID=985759 RepID=A0ABP8P2Z2_9MICO